MQQELLNKVSEKMQYFNSQYKDSGEKFNIFKILDVETRETKICRFLWQILSPSESHYQGIFFLKSFIKNVLGLNISDDELQKANIFREYTTENGRRIDILIRTSRHVIPIEVKIYAWDLKAQCRDYYEYAQKFYENKNDAKIFYLTPDGHKPSPESSCNVPVKCISFESDIYNWISYCIAQPEIIRNPPICEVLRQFAEVVKKFTGEMEDKLKMSITELITSSPENMRAANEIYSNMKIALKNLRVKFFELVEEKMRVEKNIESDKSSGEIYYKIDTRNGNYFGGLFYYAKDNDKAKPGARLDMEHGIAYIGAFILETGKWINDHECTLDNGLTPNFQTPNDALFELCKDNEMEKFAEKCKNEIINCLDEL